MNPLRCKASLPNVSCYPQKMKKKKKRAGGGQWIGRTESTRGRRHSPSQWSRNASHRYKRYTLMQQILASPDNDIGSVITHKEWHWIYDPQTETDCAAWDSDCARFSACGGRVAQQYHRQSNSRSQHQRVSPHIWSGFRSITVFDNGPNIPIKRHSTEKVWIPELIFGHLLTSSNYKSKERKNKKTGRKRQRRETDQPVLGRIHGENYDGALNWNTGERGATICTIVSHRCWNAKTRYKLHGNLVHSGLEALRRQGRCGPIKGHWRGPHDVLAPSRNRYSRRRPARSKSTSMGSWFRQKLSRTTCCFVCVHLLSPRRN